MEIMSLEWCCKFTLEKGNKRYVEKIKHYGSRKRRLFVVDSSR